MKTGNGHLRNENHLTISLCGKERSGVKLRNIFSGQMRHDYFPVPMDDMGARFTFWEPDETDYTARSGIRVKFDERRSKIYLNKQLNGINLNIFLS